MSPLHKSALALLAWLPLAALSAQGQEGSRCDLQEACDRLSANDLEGAVRGFREVVAREPENERAWFLLGYSLHVLGELEEALEVHLRAAQFEKTRPKALYNAACALALLGRPDEALERLEDALEAGFDNYEILRQDPDLASLREDPRFQALSPPAAAEARFGKGVRVLTVLRGGAPGDQFGWEGKSAGDVDGDGEGDLVLSAPYEDAGGANAGRIYVHSAATGAVIYSRSGEPGDYLGIGIAGAGDLNGDGRAEVLCGAPRLGRGAGRAYVYTGRDGKTLFRLTAGEDGDSFGWEVASLGDLDGDGRPELGVGAPGSDRGGENAGRAYVFSGREGHLLATLDGEAPGDAFGGSMAGWVGADRRLLAVGAGDAGAGDRGRVYVFHWKGGEPRLAFRVDADETGVNLGRMFLSFVGDLDGDGVADLYASDWENKARGRATGRVYVHSGATGERLLTLTGERAGDGFGIGSGRAGDVDGDGRADLVVGAWRNGDGAPSGGKVYFFSGRQGAELGSWVCETAGETFGFDVDLLEDLDGEGRGDFLVTGAWSGEKTGRAFVIAGPRFGR